MIWFKKLSKCIWEILLNFPKFTEPPNESTLKCSIWVFWRTLDCVMWNNNKYGIILVNNPIFSNFGLYTACGAVHVSSWTVAKVNGSLLDVYLLFFRPCWKKTLPNNTLSPFLEFSSKILLFQITFLIFNDILNIYSYFLLDGLLLQHMGLFESREFLEF